MSDVKRIEIWADTRGKATCRGCRAPIEWAEVVKSGKRMPFDGEIVALQTRHDLATHRLIEAVDLSTNHWGTCPQAKSFR
jgi:hypothetical protein